MKTASILLVMLIAGFGCTKNNIEGPVIGTTDEPQYLIFFPDSIGEAYQPNQDPQSRIDLRVGQFIERFGTTGNGKHQLGFAMILPVWDLDALMPGRMEAIIAAAFQVAAKRNIAVYFSISATYSWEARSDLWNFYDPSLKGYNMANKNNVEWIDWGGHPLLTRDGKSYRYSLNSGAAARLAPHMCYNSPAVLAEVARFCRIIGGAINQGVQELQAQGKEYLFAGITVSDEPTLDNYAAMTGDAFQSLIDLMKEDGTPLATLGYCALTNAGYSAANTPKDLAAALADANSQFITFWAKELNKNGIATSKMYNHVPAGAGEVGTPLFAFANAPLDIAFNNFARPGWTTYAIGPISNNFNALYDLLNQHGVSHWGGTEANPYGLGGAKIEPYEYLRMHYDHGATVVVMNSGAAPPLASTLYEGLWNAQAIEAHKRFLRGQ